MLMGGAGNKHDHKNQSSIGRRLYHVRFRSILSIHLIYPFKVRIASRKRLGRVLLDKLEHPRYKLRQRVRVHKLDNIRNLPAILAELEGKDVAVLVLANGRPRRRRQVDDALAPDLVDNGRLALEQLQVEVVHELEARRDEVAVLVVGADGEVRRVGDDAVFAVGAAVGDGAFGCVCVEALDVAIDGLEDLLAERHFEYCLIGIFLVMCAFLRQPSPALCRLREVW